MKPSYEQLKAALKKIAEIENQFSGGEWDEIEYARSIANSVLENKPLPASAPWE